MNKHLTVIRFVAVAAGVLAMIGTLQANAQTILTGPTVQDITTAADTNLVLNTGSYVSGVNLGNSNISATIDGVLFKPTAGGNVFEGPSTVPGTFLYIAAVADVGYYTNTGHQPYVAAFAPLLDSVYDTLGGEAVVGLNSNFTYRLQLFIGDNRDLNYNTFSYKIDSGSYNPVANHYTQLAQLTNFAINNLGGSTNSSESAVVVTVTFTGLSALDVSYLAGGNTLNPILNGMSLFQIAAIPEPSTNFQITAISREADNMRITWMDIAGHTDIVQVTNGSAGNYTTNFTDLSPQIVLPGFGNVTTNYLDIGGATNFPARYYRVRLVP